MGEEMLWGVKNGDLPTVKKCVENQVREFKLLFLLVRARNQRRTQRLTEQRTVQVVSSYRPTTTSASATTVKSCDMV